MEILPSMISYMFNSFDHLRMCSRAGFAFSGVQWGKECFCGHDPPPKQLRFFKSFKKASDKSPLECSSENVLCKLWTVSDQDTRRQMLNDVSIRWRQVSLCFLWCKIHLCLKGKCKKKTFFLGLCPKHRTPPTHRAHLGLHWVKSES